MTQHGRYMHILMFQLFIIKPVSSLIFSIGNQLHLTRTTERAFGS